MDHRPERVAETAAALVVVVAGVLFAVLSSQYAYTVQFGRPGPGFWPLWTSMVLAVAGVVIAVQALCRPPRDPAAGDPAGELDRRRPLLVMAALLALVAFIQVLGFLIAAVAFVFVVLRLVERVSLPRSLLAAVIIPVALFVVFDSWLQVPLPLGVVLP